MSLTILGIGTVVPQQKIQQHHAALLAGSLLGSKAPAERTMQAMYRQTRIQQRFSVVLDKSQDGEIIQDFFDPAETQGDRGPTTAKRMQRYEGEATPLATAAVKKALDRTNLKPAAITHLITCSCTGFQAPGIDVALMKKFDLSAQISRTHIGFMGCHGGFNALRVAKAYAESDPHAVVLIVCIELCSLHFQYTEDPEQIVANSIFADGAAALIGCSSESPESLAPDGWSLVDQTSVLLPNSADHMGWTIGDNGFEMTLSPEVPARIAEALPSLTDSFLQRHHVMRNNITHWAVHPGGPRILTMVEEALQLSSKSLDTSRDILAQYGNMSSATIFFILEQLFARKKLDPTHQNNNTCVAMAFGPGLTTELALFTSFSDSNERVPT
ncbi:MAG: type III polyketide synthase [Planctomycetaceae bacterium]|nr:type III polyketide synthase [Planctomycetaceae bacterium]